MKRMCALALGLWLLASTAEATTTYSFTTATAQLTVLPVASLSETATRDLICLSLNIYHESRGTSTLNQLAVALVTRNRQRARGGSVCEVVYERLGGARSGAQFSWTTKRLPRLLERNCWDQAQRIAWRVMMEADVVDITRGATHFYERHLNPSWAQRAASRVNIGAHTFVRLTRFEEVAAAR